MHEAEAGVAHREEPSRFSEHDLVSAWVHVAGELAGALLGVEAAGERAVVGAEARHVGGVERDVRVDPEELVEPVGEGVGRELAPLEIDARARGSAADDVALLFEAPERALALDLDVPAVGHEHDAAGRIHGGFADSRGRRDARSGREGRASQAGAARGVNAAPRPRARAAPLVADEPAGSRAPPRTPGATFSDSSRSLSSWC